MNYIVEIKLCSVEEQSPGRSYDDESQTKLGVKKTVEANTEKQALQKVVNLITDKETK